MGALHSAVAQGKALYGGISSYSAKDTEAAGSVLGQLGTPLLIHQPLYSILDRSIERDGLLDTLEGLGAGCIGFMPLMQGLLTDRYLHGVPSGSRASRADSTLPPGVLTSDLLDRITSLNEIASKRGQSLAQMALAWTLRDPRMTSTLMGASSVEQLEANVGALEHLDFTDDELEEIKGAVRRR
jgi:L-glyceraldehyde 3-phosphate reductase